MLIDLDAPIEPSTVVDDHLDRMQALTDTFDDVDTRVARAEAELRQIEFVHRREDDDPVLFVEVVRRAADLDQRLRDAVHVGERRVAAEAALTAQMLRERLRQDPTSIAVALDELALRLGDEDDDRLGAIRLDAMVTASRLRIEHGDDRAVAPEVLHRVLREAPRVRAGRVFAWRASLLLADLALADGATPDEAVSTARALLIDEAAAGHTPHAASLAIRHLHGILRRLDDQRRPVVEAEDWTRLVDAYAAATDPRTRAVVLTGLVRAAQPTARTTDGMLAVLRHADALARADDHPDTALPRFSVAALITQVLGHPDGAEPSRSSAAPARDPQEAVRLSVEVEQRFVTLWSRPDGIPAMAALLLDRGLRLSDLGRRAEARSALATLRNRVDESGLDIARVERAQAAYWTIRFLLEEDQIALAREGIGAILAEFGTDPSADVRIWAATALWSTWRSGRVDQPEAAALRQEFARRFADDPDVRLRRLDASRLLGEAAAQHEAGHSDRALALFQQIEQRYGEVQDDDIQDTVRIARENARIVAVATAAAGAGAYRVLRDRVQAADDLAAQGRIAEAEPLWHSIVAETTGATDPDLVVLRLAALDVWAGWMQEAGRWEQVAQLSQQAAVLPSQADSRAHRVQARAHLRLGMALTKLGDHRGAIRAYEALDALAAGTSDLDTAVSRQQAVYNRAVLIDELGDPLGALAAYEHVVAVHGQHLETAGGHLRCAKALRNQAATFTELGRTAEAAGAHRRVLDLVAVSTDPELMIRAKKSGFDLAAACTMLGDFPCAVATYAWMRSTPQLGLSAAELREVTRAEKNARRGRR
ncbi:hypothetical protein [Cellulomonas sp. NPDC089187]|uniref:hypothetical protein n=1 Tax=Cellulomonas sp. NPDC089187 TaxID=3154970 RepID=UPI0034430290